MCGIGPYKFGDPGRTKTRRQKTRIGPSTGTAAGRSPKEEVLHCCTGEDDHEEKIIRRKEKRKSA